MEVMFVESRYKGRLSDELIGKIEEAIKDYKKINLVASVQYLNQMDELTQKIKDKEFVIKQSKYRAMHKGQILGCDVYAADCPECDAILSLTQGYFHVLGIPIKYDKPVINVDPETGEIEVIDKKMADKYRKRILQGIGLALSAKKIMFVESTKAGQTYGAKMLKKAMEQKGIEVYSLVADEINFNRLNEFRDIDVFVSTACQRIAIDEMDKVEKPIINAEDLESYFLKQSAE